MISRHHFFSLTYVFLLSFAPACRNVPLPLLNEPPPCSSDGICQGSPADDAGLQKDDPVEDLGQHLADEGLRLVEDDLGVEDDLQVEDDGPCKLGSREVCFDAEPEVVDVGTCRAGERTCQADGWSACIGAVAPVDEVADGLDNDCDGTIDEDFPCVVGEEKTCGKDVGQCKTGTQSCVAGQWGDCEGAVIPEKELCDGKDNDCDGEVDEPIECCEADCAGKACGAPDGCGGTCQSGSCPTNETCQAGSCVCSVAAPCCGATCGVVCAGQNIHTVKSCDGRFRLVMQPDGNFVLYMGSSPLWSAKTQHSGHHAIMQNDGNLVVYNEASIPKWNSGTNGFAGAFLRLQDDGNLIIYDKATIPLWSTNTCCH